MMWASAKALNVLEFYFYTIGNRSFEYMVNIYINEEYIIIFYLAFIFSKHLIICYIRIH